MCIIKANKLSNYIFLEINLIDAYRVAMRWINIWPFILTMPLSTVLN